MLGRWDREQPGRVQNIARSLQRVVPSHLGDSGLFDFAALQADTDADSALSLLDLNLRRNLTPES